jgi:hypothetical protein
MESKHETWRSNLIGTRVILNDLFHGDFMQLLPKATKATGGLAGTTSWKSAGCVISWNFHGFLQGKWSFMGFHRGKL